MLTLSFIDRASHLFFGSLAVALLLGIGKSLAPRITPWRRVARLVGTPLVFVALFTGIAHAASFCHATSTSAMAVALVSPMSRGAAARKLAARIRANEKTEHAVAELVALDLAARDCEAAQVDAYRYRAWATWPKLEAVCGPSVWAARALFEEARFEDAAVAFEDVRRARPDTWMEIDELTAYVLTKRTAVAAATLRALKPRGSVPGELACLADAVATYGGSKAPWGPPPERSRCPELGLGFLFASMPPNPPSTPERLEPATCVPQRKSAREDSLYHQMPCAFGPPRYAPMKGVIPFVTEESASPAMRARWLLFIDDHAGALAVVDRELGTYGWNAPLYPSAVRAEHQALMREAQRHYPETIWIRSDCEEEIRVANDHPLAKRVAKDRELYDPARDEADRAHAAQREEALAWAYDVAAESLNGAQAALYRAGSSGRPRTVDGVVMPGSDRRVPLLLAFSSRAAQDFFDGADVVVREAAVAGSGTRLAQRLRALDVSGAGVVDSVGQNIPEGRGALAAFSRYDARFDCGGGDRKARCSAMALLGALGTRHRVARAAGDERTVRETREALDRAIARMSGLGLQNEPLATVLGVGEAILEAPDGPRGEGK